MDPKNFTGNNEVIQIISDLRSQNVDKKIFSDVIDDNNNQYVDIVQEGGGVLGIALVGYTYVLEQMGIRFFSLGGTSAGAINTLLLGAMGKIEITKSEKVLEIIANKNLFDLVDGPNSVKHFFKSILNDSWMGSKIFWGLSILSQFLKYKGLNPGDNFLEWITRILKNYEIITTKDLTDLRVKPEGLKLRAGVEGITDDLIPKLKIIAADITTESRIIFPEMNKLYWDNPGAVPPADYLRASMSIPAFFFPYKIKVGSNVKKEDWVDLVSYNGDVPQEVLFVDGGIMSNFPIDVFHNKTRVPRLPTFGVKLGEDRDKANSAGNIPQFLMAIFNSSRHVLDYQFLLKNEDFKELIGIIDVGQNNWLNFSIPDNAKLDLFIRGVKAAKDFLIKFDWEKYKGIRRKLLAVNQQKSLL